MAKKRIIILSEPGQNKYPPQKMQSTGIELLILSKDLDLTKHPVIRAQEVKCYILGSCRQHADILESCKEYVSQKGLNWEFLECSSEDEVLSNENLKFPEAAVVRNKSVSRGNQDIRRMLDSMKSDGISDSDIAGVLMAAEEISGMRIFPPTKDNIYHAFLHAAESYIPDRDRAKAAVDHFLTQASLF